MVSEQKTLVDMVLQWLAICIAYLGELGRWAVATMQRGKIGAKWGDITPAAGPVAAGNARG